MINKRAITIMIVLNLLIINGVTLAVLNSKYPLIGHDYTLGLPSLLDNALHFRLNGFAIQWFTPTFGGGIPVYPNPNTMQYSIPALLTVIMPPWHAIMTTVVLYITFGFLACFYFFHQVVGLHWTSSMLGSIFFSANGFIITRIATGQLGYFSFTFLPVFLILLCEQRIPAKITGTLFGLAIAFYIYSAGYFIIIIFGLSIMITLPLLHLIRPTLLNFKQLLITVLVGGILGGIISSSKLVAAFSFMSFFPRLIEDTYQTSLPLGIIGIILQLLGSQSLVPIFILAGLAPSKYPAYTRLATGSNYGMWELDISIAPIIFVILTIFAIRLLYNPQKYAYLLDARSGKLALIFFLFFTYLTLEFILAKGFFYPILRNLPILSSLRGNVRFTGALIFPLAFSAAAAYNHFLQVKINPVIFKTYLVVNMLTVLPLGSYFLFDKDMYWMFYDVSDPQTIHQEMIAGKSFEITAIGNPVIKNTGALLYRTSNLNLYEPVFGFKLENFHPEVKPGSVWDVSNGHFNMTDPTGFIYPSLNNNKPFERFKVDSQETMELFVKHIQPKWKIPGYQIFLNWLSGGALLCSLGYISFQVFNTRRRQNPV